jgi:cystathionine beta-lyase
VYNFDEVIDRRGSGSVKWDAVKDDVIPLWVADMDFPSLPELREVLVRRAEHPFYGYKAHAPEYYEAIRRWYQTQHGLEVPRPHILSGPGTVLSLGMIVREFSREGEGVLLLTPVYTPFFEVVRENRRRVVEVPFDTEAGEGDEAGSFILDIEKIERAVKEAEEEGIKVPLALFCSPHNPGGRVWTPEEIAAFLAFAEKRNIVAAVDEIHGDFVYGETGRHFVSAASLERYADRVIVVSGANKSFNLGGLHISHFVIRDNRLRRIMKAAVHRETHHESDVFAELAVETVYRCGAAWIEELRGYLKQNILAAVQFLNREVPGVRAFVPGGTYLIWADVRRLIEKAGCKDDAELVKRLEDQAKVKITPGSIYGQAGLGHVRINIAGPRSIIMEGLERIKRFSSAPAPLP